VNATEEWVDAREVNREATEAELEAMRPQRGDFDLLRGLSLPELVRLDEVLGARYLRGPSARDGRAGLGPRAPVPPEPPKVAPGPGESPDRAVPAVVETGGGLADAAEGR